MSTVMPEPPTAATAAEEGCCGPGVAWEDSDMTQGLRHLTTALLVSLQCRPNMSLYCSCERLELLTVSPNAKNFKSD